MKPIPDWPGYFVTKEGEVWSQKGKQLRRRELVDVCGYQTVVLFNNGRRQTKYVHRLVLRVFHREPRGSEQCHHLDKDPHNNQIENLAWVTPARNTQARGSSVQLSPTNVFNIRALARDGHRTYREIAKMYDCSQRTVGGIVRGETWREVGIL